MAQQFDDKKGAAAIEVNAFWTFYATKISTTTIVSGTLLVRTLIDKSLDICFVGPNHRPTERFGLGKRSLGLINHTQS
jgi:hypothetical protein